MKIRGIGHRGYPAKYPENTMSSFQAAIELGYTHMELDVHLSKDGVPVVMHDHRIDRMTDGTGEIRDYTLSELKQFTIMKNEKIPALEEVLLLAKDRIIVSIELKDPKLYKGIERKVYEVIKKKNMIDQVYIISFDHKSLAKLRLISKDLELGPLVNKLKRSYLRLIDKLDAKYLAVKFNTFDSKLIKKYEKRGVQIVVWTVNQMERMRYLEKYPSILVTTDELEKYREFMIEKKQERGELKNIG